MNSYKTKSHVLEAYVREQEWDQIESAALAFGNRP